MTFALTWLLGVSYLASWVRHGWIPYDDGLLAQSAASLLHGQLPHRDFDDLYTGGLTALHATAFAVLGVRLVTLRIVLLMAAALWVAVVYGVARRFVPPLVAAIATLVCVAWSVPNYNAAMPSWYNLFLATAGLLALLKYTESGRERWLVAAGMYAGLSILVKIVGLYFLAAAGLFVLYSAYEHNRPQLGEGGATLEADGVGGVTLPRLARSREARRSRYLARGLALGAACALVLAVVRLVYPAFSMATCLYLVLPPAAVSIAFVLPAWQLRALSWQRLRRGSVALALGVAAVIVPFAAVYVRAHALGALYNGVVVLPARRFTFAIAKPDWPGLDAVGIAGVLVASLVVSLEGLGIFVAGLVVVMMASLHVPQIRQAVDLRLMETARVVLPVLACAFVLLTASRPGRRLTRLRRLQVFAVVSVASFCALIDYPYFAWIYFFYYAPLVVLAAVAVFGTFGRRGGKLIGVASLAFCIPFIVARMPSRSAALLAIPRGGILVPSADSVEAAAMVDTLRQHARNGYTFATPDCPEVYFLTGLSNPTRTTFDFFDDAAGRTDRLIRLLEARHITAVAINRWPPFSGAPDPRLMAAFVRRYPDSVRVGRYTLRWQP